MTTPSLIDALLMLRQAAQGLSAAAGIGDGEWVVPGTNLRALRSALSDVSEAVSTGTLLPTYDQSDEKFGESLLGRTVDDRKLTKPAVRVIVAARPFIFHPDSFSVHDMHVLARAMAESNSEREEFDREEFGLITELFHPDMNVSDIRLAIVSLITVFDQATAVVRDNVGLGLLRKSVGDCRVRFWKHRPTQLEKDEQPVAEADARDAAECLWGMLDDIDTLSDQIKPCGLEGYKTFYAAALTIAKRRHAVLKSDGHALAWPSKLLATAVVPLEILLYCPMCHTKHIDEGEFRTKPHHTHACQGYVEDEGGKRRRCGHVWRPSKAPTVGVEFLEGFINEEPESEHALVGRRARVLVRHDRSGVIVSFDERFARGYHVQLQGDGELLWLRRDEFEVLPP